MFFRKSRSNSFSARQAAWVLALTSVTVVGTAPSVWAQASAGITGTVLDPSGAVVPNAHVTITDESTGRVIKTDSSSAGTFSVTGLTPSQYQVKVEAEGFKTLVQKNVNVEVSVNSTRQFQLTSGQTTQEVQVTANSIALNTTAPQLGTTIEPAVVKALPVEVSGRGRQIDTLQFTAPGVQGDTFSHRIGGGVDFQQEILYNGVPVVQPETEGYTQNFNPPFEMVQEFRVERSTFAAQYGLGQGALTYQFASGTNHYHGDLFEINRNSYFDSVGFFNGRDRNPANVKNAPPTDRENNYGFTIGGPISIPHIYNGKDRTFGHYSQEWFKQVQLDLDPATVPTALQKTGNFSDYVDSKGNLIPIYDPQTGQPFPGNIIPAARISPTSAQFLQYLPDPDRPGTGGGGLESNKAAVPIPNPYIQHVWGFTIDQTLTQKQSLHYSEWRNTFNNFGFDRPPFVLPPNPLNSQKTYPYIGTGFVVNYSYTIRPNLLMTAGGDWIGEINNQFNPTQIPSPVTVGGTVSPDIGFDGQHSPTSWGTSGSWGGSVNRKLGIAIVNNWLWTKGRNTFNIGGEFRRAYQDDNEEQTSGGHFQFSQRETSVPDTNSPNFGSYGSGFASYLLGLPDSANRSNSQELRLRNVAISPYIQDDIKLSPKLTLNLGVRWDILVPFTENNNLVVFFDPYRRNPAAGNLLGAANKLGNCADCAGYNRAYTHFGHFGPRFGLSYQINQTTVVQAGFALAYLNGGAYEYGTHKVAVSYGNLLTGSYNRNSSGGTNSTYGSWDGNPLPNPPATPFSTGLGVGTQIFDFSQKDGYAPYTEQWNANVQHQLPWNTFVTLAWLGNRVIHLPSTMNPVSQLNPQYLALRNQLSDTFAPGQQAVDGVAVPYGNFANDFGGSATVRQALQPFPQYSNVNNLFDGAGTTSYESFQVQAEKRLSNGLSFLAGYTLARLMDNTSSGFSTFTAAAINKFNQKPEFVHSTSEIPNSLVVSGTYELPIGPGKTYLNNHGLTGQLLGGWQIGWITRYEAGTVQGITENGVGLGNGNRPNRVAGVKLGTASYNKAKAYFLGKASQDDSRVFDPAAFQTTDNYTIGDALRAYPSMRNPASYNEDANVRKHFFLGDKFQAILQFDYFNLLNRTRLQGADNNASDDAFGEVTNAHAANGLGNRQGQIQARIEF